MNRLGKEITIKIPRGCFTGNCADCKFANFNDRNKNGEVWCDHYQRYYEPKKRNGCGSFEDNGK